MTKNMACGDLSAKGIHSLNCKYRLLSFKLKQKINLAHACFELICTRQLSAMKKKKFSTSTSGHQ
jgi:hypothetical protein